MNVLKILLGYFMLNIFHCVWAILTMSQVHKSPQCCYRRFERYLENVVSHKHVPASGPMIRDSNLFRINKLINTYISSLRSLGSQPPSPWAHSTVYVQAQTFLCEPSALCQIRVSCSLPAWLHQISSHIFTSPGVAVTRLLGLLLVPYLHKTPSYHPDTRFSSQ